MLENLYYSSRFRSFLHYAYLPTVAVASFALCSWLFKVDTDVYGYDRLVEVSLVQSVSEPVEKARGPYKEAARKRKIARALEIHKLAAITDCEHRNEQAERRYARSNTSTNWRDWAAIDSECRSLRGE